MTEDIDPQAALVYTMVLVSAAESDMTDREIETMSRVVRQLPVFADFEPDRIPELGEECIELLRRDDGLEVAFARIAKALTPPLRETAYVLACEVAAADGRLVNAEIHMLEQVRHGLKIDRLVAAAIERAARARHRTA